MTDTKLTLELLQGSYAVSRQNPTDEIPGWAFKGAFLSITRTMEELSIVCSEEEVPENTTCERGWNILKIVGPLDFTLIGILAPICAILAQQRISIFAVSTFDTDYILVKAEKINKAREALCAEGYNVIR